MKRKTLKRRLSAILTLCMVLALLPGTALAADEEADTPKVTITATSIEADSVDNYDGYGRPKINSNRDEIDLIWDFIPAQLALIDRDGEFLFPYQDDPIGTYYDGDAVLTCYDGIVSLAMNTHYSPNRAAPQYFNLDGTPAFTLEETQIEYDEDGWHYVIRTSYAGSPMMDSYAVVIEQTNGTSSSGGVGGSLGYTNKFEIIDKNGKVAYVLPEDSMKKSGYRILASGPKWS